MFRKTVVVEKQGNDGIRMATESYYFFALLIYRRDVVVYLPQ